MNEEHCCCGGQNGQADPEKKNRVSLAKLGCAFHWAAYAAALYFALLIVAQWVMYFTAPSGPMNDYRWGLLNTASYVVVGALVWALLTAFSLAIERLLMLPVKCGEEGK